MHLYPAAIAWQHVAVPRAKTPGAPGSTPRRDVRLLLEVRAAEDAAAALDGKPGGGAGEAGKEGTVVEDASSAGGAAGNPGKTPQKSMPALRAELAHRLALHYLVAYRCAPHTVKANACTNLMSFGLCRLPSSGNCIGTCCPDVTASILPLHAPLPVR